jgi:starvation-inducible DNA-binding protein
MEQLIQQLKVILGTNFALYLKSHNYHWNVEGPDFAQYHKFLGKLYEQIFGNTDLIAEKIRMLGSYAPGSMERFIELSDIEEATSVPDAMTMLRTLSSDNERFIFHLRAGIAAADQTNEPAISNFLQEILDQHQKHAWMIRSIIK